MTKELKDLGDKLAAANLRAKNANAAFFAKAQGRAAESAAVTAEVKRRDAAGVRVTVSPNALSSRRLALWEGHAAALQARVEELDKANAELSAVAAQALGLLVKGAQA